MEYLVIAASFLVGVAIGLMLSWNRHAVVGINDELPFVVSHKESVEDAVRMIVDFLERRRKQTGHSFTNSPLHYCSRWVFDDQILPKSMKSSSWLVRAVSILHHLEFDIAFVERKDRWSDYDENREYCIIHPRVCEKKFT